MKRQRTDRTSLQTLRQLAAHHLFFDLDPRRRTPLPPLAAIGMRVARLFAERHEDREVARAAVEREAAKALGLRGPGQLNDDERRAFANFAPLVLLAGASRWPKAQRSAG